MPARFCLIATRPVIGASVLRLRDALQFALHVDQAAVALLVEHRELRIGLLLARRDVGFQLLQRALALLQHEDVLLAVDRRR